MTNEEKRLKAALEFITKGNMIHNNFYKDGYGEVEYINNHTKVKIKCPKHGFFYQEPKVHINQKGGCPECAQIFFDNGRLKHYEDRKNIARLEFEKKANIVHNNKYKDGYNNDYKDSKTKIKIKCPEHDFFFQRPKNHLNGNGCPKCGNKISFGKKLESSKVANERKRLKASLEFTDKANKVHNGFYKDGYIGKYINARTKLEINCPIEGHGVFWQTPNNHLRGQGCPKCAEIIAEIIRKENGKIGNEKMRLKAKEGFGQVSNKRHNNFYNYDRVKYIDKRTKVEIGCGIPEHGYFWQSPGSHKRGNGCPICKYSHGEREIWKFLKEAIIDFIPQYIYEDCKGDYKELPFDFYIPSLNLLIEYDGEQHYRYIPGFHRSYKDFEKTQRYDKIKNEYALSKGIELIRIRYDEELEVALSKLRDRISINKVARGTLCII